MKGKKWIILNGIIVGAVAVLLVKLGNPKNMGICVACFLRDIAGAVGLHSTSTVQYIRPEILGLVLGSFFMAVGTKEFKARGGSSPFTRFVLGFAVMIGALMFLGCPLRMILRIAGGDLNAVIGLVGFIIGILIGIVFLNKGFSLKRSYELNKAEGVLLPAVCVALLVFLIAKPAFIKFSTEGPGSMHATIAVSLIAAIIVGAFAQKTRLCMVGGIRDVVLFNDWYLMSGYIAILVTAFIGNVIFGFFKLGFVNQPIAHNDWIWNLLGMALSGFGSVLLGGCPLRQLILAGEGNIDSVMAVLGMFVGAAFAHNFGLASSANGPTSAGKIAVIIGLIVVAAIGYFNIEKDVKVTVKGDAKLEG